jgi:superfamily II DNA helicase RecQ
VTSSVAISSTNGAVTPAPAVASKGPPAVRLGRLPPRAGAIDPIAAQRSARLAGFEPIALAPLVARRALPKERFSHIEARAARMGMSLDESTRAIVRAVFEGTSTISVAARSRGHELAALAAALELPQLVLVVGPDAWVLADLRERLERAACRSTLLNDSKGATLHPTVIDGIASGASKVVLATPRWLARDALLRALGRVGVAQVIVLEAQAVSSSSASFSPALARVGLYLERLGRPPAMALSPGASTEVRHDIAQLVLPGPPQAVIGSALGSQVSLSALRCPREMRRRALCDAAERLPKPMLVLCSTPQEVDAAYDALRSLGLPTHRFHDEMRAGVRAAEQLEFSMPGDEAILVATSAFAPAASPYDDDPEGVPRRYGRRTSKLDVRSLIRCDPPASLEQLVDELSLVARDGKPGHVMVLHDPSDRSPIEARTDATRPSGEQIMLMARALESMTDGGAITTESLALTARSSRRAMEGLADLLDGMGLVTHRDGWLTRLAPEAMLLKELRSLAERYATVRVLDTQRLASMLELLARPGCRTAALGRALGQQVVSECGSCSSCRGEDTKLAPIQGRQPLARRFSVQAASDGGTGTFHADERVASRSHLTAKLADFSR